MMTTEVIGAEDDLSQVVRSINQASWDSENEMSTFDAASLRTYLQREDTLFVACYESDVAGAALMGFASSRFQHKPYAMEKWLYVDELDVCADQRRKGAGAAIMRKLIELARDAGCDEVWLGAEATDIAANALYQSLDPDDVTRVVGYTYELDV